MGLDSKIRLDYLLRSSRIALYLLSDDTKMTAKQEQYDWMSNKKIGWESHNF